MEPREKLTETFKRVDQMLTGHSLLRDRYARCGFFLDLLMLALSAALAFLAFASDRLKSLLLPSALDNEIALPMIALLIFIGTIVQWRVGWKEKSAAHNESAKALAGFKHELAKVLGQDKRITNRDLDSYLSRYQYLNESIAHIPEREFLRAKRAHKVKVKLSKQLDDHPGAFLWLLRARLTLKDSFCALFCKKDKV